MGGTSLGVVWLYWIPFFVFNLKKALNPLITEGAEAQQRAKFAMQASINVKGSRREEVL